ncbi:MAG: hypothetical protein GTN73_05905 [Candidatus Aminicenantes bacterium]|nr:hypothetical protein [Candidatus Aminicenantes bacterium]
MASTEMPSQTRLITEFIKVRLESLKHRYDYFKNMTTLNIGAFSLWWLSWNVRLRIQFGEKFFWCL